VPDYELHADYDRSGRMSARPDEYALRGRRPGAVVVPNLDVDARALPRTVTAGRRVTLDKDQPVKATNDDENLPVRIHTRTASAPAGSQFFLRMIGRMKIHIEFHDARGIIFHHPPGIQDDVLFTPPAAGGNLDITMELQSIPGTPYGRSTMLDTSFTDDGSVETRITLELRSRAPGGSTGAAGVETLWDTAVFSLAPVVFLDNAAPAVRMYVADNGSNEPSVEELEDAFTLLSGVDLVRVPPAVGGGDSWLQDQFQHGLMQGADGYRQVLLHLPRLRSNNAVSGTGGNLADLVMSHFPSREIGVFDDLWDRKFTFNDAAGRQTEISFRNSYPLSKVISRVLRLRSLLVELIQRFDSTWADPGFERWSQARATLRDLFTILRGKVRRAVEAGTMSRTQGTQYEDDVRERIVRVETLVPMSGANLTLPSGTSTVTVTADTADAIHRRISQAHGSANYGGNFEPSPPIGMAELGKLVIGNNRFTWAGQAWDFIDPDVMRILVKQNKQPLVTLNTAWLHVGHVDEVIAFAPDGRHTNPDFAVLRASGLLAQRILFKARERYKSGLPAGYHWHKDYDEPAGTELNRRTDEGTSPVTRMFRGKVWHHIHRPEQPTGETPFLEPPQIFQFLNFVVRDFGDIRYVPGASDHDRVYLADMTVREAVWCERDTQQRSVNEFIETQFMAPINATMESEFEGARGFPLPVLFDRVANIDGWADNSIAMTTMAFTPALVNYQVVKGRLLVPRPYGPRMRLDDARAIYEEVIRELELPDILPRLTSRLIRRRNLHTGVYWIHRFDTRGIQFDDGRYVGVNRGLLTKEDIIEQFRDSFPGASDTELERRIIRPNSTHFHSDGRLKDGWRKFEIEDDMLDLFETWMELVAAEIDAPISWIDSWHYHVHSGGIHCGTNVLRIPRRRSLPNTWDTADADTPVMEFEGLEL
jgi:hypothetical protein